VSLISLYLEYFYLRQKKYKITAFYSFLVSPIILFIRWLLNGLFVKKIILFSKIIPYIHFLLVSSLFFEIFWLNVQAVLNTFYSTKFLSYLIYYGEFYAILLLVTQTLISTTLRYFPVFLFLYIFIGKNIIAIVVASAVSLILIIPAIGLAFTLSPLLLYFRGRGREVISRNVKVLISFLIPVGFTYITFCWYKILRWFPVIGLVEELRRLVFLEKINSLVFFIGLLESILLLIIGTTVFKVSYAYARKQGWIGLR